MSQRVVVNIDDFCDGSWAIMEDLFALKKRYLNFKVTLFTIPFKTSPVHLLAAKETGWIELAVHGFNHVPKEMLTLTKENIIKGFSKINFSIFTRGFRAPYWLMNEQVIECCNRFEMWLAIHHTKNPSFWKNLCKCGYYYPVDTDNFECWYGHTYDIKRELPNLLTRWTPNQGFAFVSEAIQISDHFREGIKLNFGAGNNPLKDCINLDSDQSCIEHFPDYDMRECDLRNGLGMFDNNSVDAATLSHTLMYLKVEEYHKFFAEVYRVFKTGGVFRITEDDCEYPGCSEYSLPRDYAFSATGPKMMRRELERVGFEVHDISEWGETLWVDNSLMQHFHGDPLRIFYVEAVKVMRKIINLRTKLLGYNCGSMKVLNVGAGGDAVIGLPPQLREIEFGQLDHLDVYDVPLEKTKGVKWNAKAVNFILEDIRNFDFSDYDLFLMFDVVEHLPKADALEILKKIKHAFIFIPLETGELMDGEGIPFGKHLSRWAEQEFIDLGFRTEVLKNFHGSFDAMWAEK